MKYAKRTVQSQPGLSQEQALLALQSHPSFKQGTRISSIRRKGSQWVADLLEPQTRVAGPPPFADDGEDDGPAPADSGPPEDDGGGEEEPSGPPDDGGSEEGPPDSPDGPPGPPGEEKGKGGKQNIEAEILHVLTQILHALPGGGDPEGMGGPDALGPADGGPAAPPPPHGHAGPPGGGPPGMGGPPKGPPGGRPMKPGEAPPGSTPVGAPAFASRQAALPGAPMGAGAPVPGGAPTGVGGPPGGAAGTCAQCGYPEPCPMHGAGAAGAMGPAVAAVRAQVQKVAGRSAQVTLKAPGSMQIGDAVKVAREAVTPYGYQVKKASRVNDRIVILAYARR